MIIDRYLGQEIAKPLFAICGALFLIFAGYSTARYLGEAASDQLPGNAVAALIFLKIVTVADVLLPMALFLSVVWALGRMYNEEEMTALAAAGVSDLRVIWATGRLMLLVVLVVALVSLFLRPWAYRNIYEIENRAETQFDINNVQPLRFYNAGDSRRVIYAEAVDHPTLLRAFMQSDTLHKSRVISARTATEKKAPKGEPRQLIFNDGFLYVLDRHGEADRVVEFERMTLLLEPQAPPQIGFKRRATPTRELASATHPKLVAEYQWRWTAPVSVILLGLLGIFISRGSPRRSKYTKVLWAILACALYYNLSAVAQTWVERGSVGAVPGIWWVQGLFFGGLLLLAYWPNLRR